MRKMAMGTPKSPIKRLTWWEQIRNITIKERKKLFCKSCCKICTRTCLGNIQSQTTHLSWKKCSILELAQEKSNKETAKHEAHGEEGCVGVRQLNIVDENSCISSGIVIDDGLFHLWVPGVVQRCIQMIVIQNQWMWLKGLERSQERIDKERL